MFCRVLPLRSTATSAEFLDVVLRCGELPRCLTVHEVEPKHRKEDIHSLKEHDGKEGAQDGKKGMKSCREQSISE
jgi:hypothetical protein